MVGRPSQIMQNLKTNNEASFPVLNGLGFIFGLIGVVAIFIQQSLTTFYPFWCHLWCALYFVQC